MKERKKYGQTGGTETLPILKALATLYHAGSPECPLIFGAFLCVYSPNTFILMEDFHYV